MFRYRKQKHTVRCDIECGAQWTTPTSLSSTNVAGPIVKHDATFEQFSLQSSHHTKFLSLSFCESPKMRVNLCRTIWAWKLRWGAWRWLCCRILRTRNERWTREVMESPHTRSAKNKVKQTHHQLATRFPLVRSFLRERFRKHNMFGLKLHHHRGRHEVQLVHLLRECVLVQILLSRLGLTITQSNIFHSRIFVQEYTRNWIDATVSSVYLLWSSYTKECAHSFLSLRWNFGRTGRVGYVCASFSWLRYGVFAATKSRW